MSQVQSYSMHGIVMVQRPRLHLIPAPCDQGRIRHSQGGKTQYCMSHLLDIDIELASSDALSCTPLRNPPVPPRSGAIQWRSSKTSASAKQRSAQIFLEWKFDTLTA